MSKESRIRAFTICMVVLGGALMAWLSVGAHREAPLVGHRTLTSEVAEFEKDVALDPGNAAKLVVLCNAYLDRKLPGFALAAIHRAPESIRRDPLVIHQWARALLYEGHASEALVKQQEVMNWCKHGDCSLWLTASARRHEAFLAALVAHGVEDYRRHPDETLAVFQSMPSDTIAISDVEL